MLSYKHHTALTLFRFHEINKMHPYYLFYFDQNEDIFLLLTNLVRLTEQIISDSQCGTFIIQNIQK